MEAVRPFGGMKAQRTWFAADKTGFHMLHTLFQTTLKYDGIQRYHECFVTRLLVDQGRCQGVVAIEGVGNTRAVCSSTSLLGALHRGRLPTPADSGLARSPFTGGCLVASIRAHAQAPPLRGPSRALDAAATRSPAPRGPDRRPPEGS